MPIAYTKKLVIAGKIVELYEYNKERFYGLRAFENKKNVIDFNKKEIDLERSKFSQRRSAFNIRALVNSNPRLNKFLTLTYKKNQKDLTESNYGFQGFVKKLKYLFAGFKYIAIVEFQKRGAIHYHLVCNLPFIQSKKIAEIWGFGFIKIKRVDRVRNLGAYFAKHGTKDDKVESKRLSGRKKFFCSRGLNRPVIIRNPEKVEPYIKKYLFGRVPFFEKQFLIEDLTLDYKQYKI